MRVWTFIKDFFNNSSLVENSKQSDKSTEEKSLSTNEPDSSADGSKSQESLASTQDTSTSSDDSSETGTEENSINESTEQSSQGDNPDNTPNEEKGTDSSGVENGQKDKGEIQDGVSEQPSTDAGNEEGEEPQDNPNNENSDSMSGPDGMSIKGFGIIGLSGLPSSGGASSQDMADGMCGEASQPSLPSGQDMKSLPSSPSMNESAGEGTDDDNDEDLESTSSGSSLGEGQELDNPGQGQSQKESTKTPTTSQGKPTSSGELKESEDLNKSSEQVPDGKTPKASPSSEQETDSHREEQSKSGREETQSDSQDGTLEQEETSEVETNDLSKTGEQKTEETKDSSFDSEVGAEQTSQELSSKNREELQTEPSRNDQRIDDHETLTDSKKETSSHEESSGKEKDDKKEHKGTKQDKRGTDKKSKSKDHGHKEDIKIEEKTDDKTKSHDEIDKDKIKEKIQKTEALRNLRDMLSKVKEKKIAEEKKEEINERDINNELMDKLKELPSWRDRDRGGSYSIDTTFNGEIPDTVIKTLISKFLRQKFCKKSTTLNSRSTSLEKSKGYFKWDYLQVLKHLETEELTKLPLDRFDYLPAQGKNEEVPLSFYFDLSGSMSEYTGLLSTISIELLKQNVKVLVGFNENVHVQIDSITEIENVDELASMLTKFGNQNYSGDTDKLIKEKGVTYRIINENIDNYLIRKKAEKCVVFADFDPRNEVVNLSKYAQVYWFCFENDITKHDLDQKFFGFLYKVKSLEDIVKGLERVNERKFESLMYINDSNILKRRMK